MKKNNFITLLFLSVTFFSFLQIPVKKLTGHWVTIKDMSFSAPGDTLVFEKKKYDPLLYTLAKYHSGIEFTADTLFKEYHNIGNDPGTDNIFYHDERFGFKSDSVIEVKGYARNFRFRILSVSSKKLSIKFLP